VLSYWLYPDAYGASSVARRLRLPLVAGARGSDIRVRDALSRALTRRVVARADRLLVVSDDLARMAASDYGADAARIRVIRNGCDAAIFRPGDRAAARAALGIPREAALCAYVGRLVVEKGLRELLDAQARLRAAGRTLQLALVGDGPLESELRQRAAQAGGPVVHLPGRLPPQSVAQWMAASDLVALPSWSEGHPNVLVEALACGRPVVATDVGGIPEVVDAASGVLVPVRDTDALARALASVLDRRWDEAELAAKFSRDWSQVAQDTLRACEEALASRRN
jgi:glycosyltransferase involved in cell wall biosynthesis